MPLCEFGIRLPDLIGVEERQLFSLTEEQCHMLDFIQHQRTALIEGCAGSGKTVMAVKKARDLAAEGHRVLLLAYNQLIGQQLAAAVADAPAITAGTYHDYCIARLDAAGRLPAGERNDDFYNRAIPEAFYELVSKDDVRYDALVIDEGQDFRADYWISISCLLRDDGFFYIFYDPDQNVFGTEMDFPIDGPPFTLTQNCRNTKAICDYVSRYASREMRASDRSPAGVPVQVSVNPSAAGRRRKVGAILQELVNEQGLSPDSIVILGGHRIDGTSLPPGSRVGDFTVVEGGGKGPRTVRYHTYMKFKGCEADAVILLDVDPSDSRWSDRAVYTTASRAKHVLYVVRAA
jgi:superfamily I DNA/RNA helicase